MEKKRKLGIYPSYFSFKVENLIVFLFCFAPIITTIAGNVVSKASPLMTTVTYIISIVLLLTHTITWYKTSYDTVYITYTTPKIGTALAMRIEKQLEGRNLEVSKYIKQAGYEILNYSCISTNYLHISIIVTYNTRKFQTEDLLKSVVLADIHKYLEERINS